MTTEYANIISDYLIHYNQFKKVWTAIKRGSGNWEKYINGQEFDGFEMKGTVNDLIKYIVDETTKT
jgi:hypothetical protein